MNNKIRGNRGITIIHALVGVLIFGVISSIIYSSAMANLNSLKNESEFQQSYLTVSSAAEAFVEGITGDYISYEVGVHTSYEDKKIIENSFKYNDYGMKNPLYIDGTGDIDHGIASDMKLVYLSSAGNNIIRTYTISAKGETELYDVKVEYCMARDYTIYANFSLVLPDGKETDNYYMCVKIPIVEASESSKLHAEDYSATPFSSEKFSIAVAEAGFKHGINRKDTYHITYDGANALFEKGYYTLNETVIDKK